MEKLIQILDKEIELAKERDFNRIKRIFKDGNQTSAGSNMKLKFRNRISRIILTGEEIKGEENTPIEVALVDDPTGNVVVVGPEASASVEIVLLKGESDASQGDDWTVEEFNENIVPEIEGNKHFRAGNVPLKLQRGIGVLENIKLKHHVSKIRPSVFKLGARVVDASDGGRIKEAKTESFTVKDFRNKYYKKHETPSLSDEVSRLLNIRKGGKIDKRLQDNEINTVKDFLIRLLIDPEGIKNEIGSAVGTKWFTTVNNARKCLIFNKEMHLYYPSTESKMGIIFDALGGLKGVIQESHYVPMNNLSADKKDCAHKLLLSAFQNRKDITSFKDEASLLKRFPCRSSDINTATNSSIQEGSNGCDLSISENINGCHPTGPGTPSQSISPDTSTSDHPNNISHFESTDTGQLYDANLSLLIKVPSCQSSDLENINKYAPRDPGTSSQRFGPCIRIFDLPNIILNVVSIESQTIGQLYDAHSGVQIRSCQSLDLDSILDKLFVENRNLTSLLNPEINNRSQTLRAKSNSHLPNNIFHCDSLGSPNMGQLLYETPWDVPKIPSCKFSYPDFILEASGDNWRRMYVVKSEINNSETLRAESHSHQQSNSRFLRLVRLVVNVKLWVDRAKKRVLALEGFRVHKKQKIVRDLNLLSDTASEVG